MYDITMSNEALNNADELIESVMDAVQEYLKHGHPVNCQHFIGEVMYKMRETALLVTGENVAEAARMLSMNRTTFYEFLRLKGWKRSKPIQSPSHRKRTRPANNDTDRTL